jgi:hypothetical protein
MLMINLPRVVVAVEVVAELAHRQSNIRKRHCCRQAVPENRRPALQKAV